MGNPNQTRLTYIVQFECMHTCVFAEPCPQLGDILWCVKCREERRIAVASAEYRMRCQRCAYSRRFGVAKMDCEIAAAKHRMRYPTHVVVMFNGHEKMKEIGNSNQSVIPMMRESNPPLAG